MREFQQQAARRVAGEGNLLRSARGKDPDRSLAAPLQHRPAALVPGLQTTRPKSHLARSVHAALLWGGGSMNAAALKPPG